MLSDAWGRALSGTSGPAGVLAVVLVLGLQAAAIESALAALLVVLS